MTRLSLSAVVVVALCAAVRADWVAINLTPPGATEAEVYAVTPTAQYGGAVRTSAPFTVQPGYWNGSAPTWTNLSPNPQDGGFVYAATGQVQAGELTGHASIWNGTPASRVDLHPSGHFTSEVHAISGSNQFGWTNATVTAQPMAAMWSGTAASYVNMNPPGANSSRITAAAGDFQGGWAGPYAGIWNGTPSSFVNVHPGGQWNASWISGMTETEEVGAVTAAPSNFPRAALWHGTAASFTLLDPGAGYSEAYATCGTAEVGYIAPASGVYAGIWFGTAASFVNLAQLLPQGVYDESFATTVATDGVHYYVGGYAENASTLRNEAFLWVGTVPAPGGFGLLVAVAVFGARRRRSS